MNTKARVIAPITALLLSLGGAGLATASSSDNAPAVRGVPGTMQDASGSEMRHMMGQDQGRGQGMGMMGHGRGMGHGMMGMMGNCPMMGMGGGLNGKAMMQMHGEMMRAMGDIMIKYADKFETPDASQ